MIDYEKLKSQMNKLELETLSQIQSRINDSRCWDLTMRHNGETKHYQVDFLKHIFRSIECD